MTRRELTAALAARQLLLERARLAPADAIRRLTPLQAQDPPAAFVALASRLDGFTRDALEAAIDAHEVVKATTMRATLHLHHAGEHGAYAVLARGSRLRGLRTRHPDLDAVTPELRAWLGAAPRSNDEIRERVLALLPDVEGSAGGALIVARMVLPLVQLPPAGHWRDPRRPRFAVDPRPLPDPETAADVVVSRYLAAFGPAGLADVAAWAGTAQRDLGGAWDRLATSGATVVLPGPDGTPLRDLRDAPRPPDDTRLPVRLLARWDQPLLAYADRSRVLPDELLGLQLTLSGAQTVLVDGRVAASWRIERSAGTVQVLVEPHVAIPRRAHGAIRAEARRMARFVVPDGPARPEVRGF